MFKVTNLAKKGKNYLVTIKDEAKEFNYKVSEDLIIENRLLVGKEFDQKQFDSLVNTINKDAYYQKVLNYALFKPRTQKEIFTYLDKYKIEDYGYYLNKLEKLKLIDDAIYAENFIFDAINYKRVGPRKITKDLRLKGIQNEYIVNFLNKFKNEIHLGNIEFWLEKKLKTLTNKPYYQTHKVLINFLINKGFDYEDVMSIINQNQAKIKNEINEDEIIVKEIKNLSTKYQKKDLKVSLNQYLINKLLAKGYQYSVIKKHLEGSL
jgi:regulatory protein